MVHHGYRGKNGVIRDLKTISCGWALALGDAQALDAFVQVSRLEGIIPALETSHAFAHLDALCPTLPAGSRVVINLSGRGDKDVNTAAARLDISGKA